MSRSASSSLIGVTRRVVLFAALLLVSRPCASDDCPPCPPVPPPPPAWRISVGGGMALTGGNTDTASYNLTANVVHDPHTRNVFRGEGLYLRSSQDDEATVDKTLLSVRDEYAVGKRAYLFGQLAYARDRFKNVDYLISPVVGAGVRLVEQPKLLFALDAGVGGAFENLTGQDSTTDLAVNATERLEWKPNGVTTVFQKAAGLWKTDDFGDAYYRFEAGLAAKVAGHLELKLAFADDYKTRPFPSSLEKNDTSIIASLLLNF